MEGKRKHSDSETALVPAKKPKNELVASKKSSSSGAIVQAGPPRSSSLLAPVMELSGHAGEIFAAQFHPDGETFATAGFDRSIFLWFTYGECKNFAVLDKGHSGAILDMCFSNDGSQLYTASTDKSLVVWDAEAGERVRRLRGHDGIVNSCASSRSRDAPMLVSGSDDRTVKVWDARRRHYAHSLASKFQVTAVAFGKDNDQVITSGIDNDIKIWDLRKQAVVHSLSSHTDTVTSLSLSPDGKSVLSNSMDNTVRIWDVQAYVPGERLLKTFVGAQHNFEKNLIKCSWAPDGRHVASGSADRCVYVWNVASQRVVYRLPGHKGTVNAVDFHPNEPILLSASSDKKVFLGELHI